MGGSLSLITADARFTASDMQRFCLCCHLWRVVELVSVDSYIVQAVDNLPSVVLKFQRMLSPCLCRRFFWPSDVLNRVGAAAP